MSSCIVSLWLPELFQELPHPSDIRHLLDYPNRTMNAVIFIHRIWILYLISVFVGNWSLLYVFLNNYKTTSKIFHANYINYSLAQFCGGIHAFFSLKQCFIEFEILRPSCLKLGEVSRGGCLSSPGFLAMYPYRDPHPVRDTWRGGLAGCFINSKFLKKYWSD